MGSGIDFYDSNGFTTDDGTVVDENGNIVSEEEATQGYQVGVIGKNGDVMRIVKDFSGKVRPEIENFQKLLDGNGYYEAFDGITRLITYISSGPHIDFCKRYDFMLTAKDRDEYMKAKSSLDYSEKVRAKILEDMMMASKDLRISLVTLLRGPVRTYLNVAFNAMKFELNMKELLDAGKVRSLREIYEEYDEVRKIYSSNNIYWEIGLTAGSRVSDSEREEIVLQAMSGDVLNSPFLSDYLANAKKMKSSAQNKLFVIDRQTTAFNEFCDKKDQLKEVNESLKKLSEQLGGIYAIGSDPMNEYFDTYVNLIDALKNVFLYGYRAIDAFETKADTAPYSVMHVYKDSRVRNCIEKYKLGDSGEIWKKGTLFSSTISMMPIQLRREAARIAHNSKMAYDG